MKKMSKELLNEELKRFRQINEYDFYVGEDYKDYDNPQDLILGEEGEEDDLGIEDLPADDSKTAGDTGVEAGADPLGDDLADAGGEDLGAEAGGEDLGGLEVGDELDGEEGLEDLGGAEDMAPAEDEVELDITQLVQGTEDAKQSADMANQKIDQLMGMLDNLEGKLDSMDGITNKIDDLENELEKRVPTPEEKLEMRSMSSYPYNLKLTDFWAQKDGKYDVMGVNDKTSEPEEYTLTTQDVNDGYNEGAIKKSFDVENEYEEEEF